VIGHSNCSRNWRSAAARWRRIALPRRKKGQEWVGVHSAWAERLFLVAREETREGFGISGGGHAHSRRQELVKGWPMCVGRSCRCWICGQFLGERRDHLGSQYAHRVVNHRDIPAGLMVDEVLGFRRFAESEFSADAPPTVIRCDSYLAGAFRRGGEVFGRFEFEESGREPELLAGGKLDVEKKDDEASREISRSKSSAAAGRARRACLVLAAVLTALTRNSAPVRRARGAAVARGAAHAVRGTECVARRSERFPMRSPRAPRGSKPCAATRRAPEIRPAGTSLNDGRGSRPGGPHLRRDDSNRPPRRFASGRRNCCRKLGDSGQFGGRPEAGGMSGILSASKLNHAAHSAGFDPVLAAGVSDAGPSAQAPRGQLWSSSTKWCAGCPEKSPGLRFRKSPAPTPNSG